MATMINDRKDANMALNCCFSRNSPVVARCTVIPLNIRIAAASPRGTDNVWPKRPSDQATSV